VTELTTRLATVLAVLAGVLLLPAVPATAQPRHGAVVVVGVPALRWADVSQSGTPALWRLAERGAVGSLSVRAAGPVTPPVDGWVTLGAGNRATGRSSLKSPAALPLVARPGGDPSFAALRRRNDRLPFDARVGSLGEALRAAGVRRVAFGPGAGIALATPDGDVDEVRPTPVADAEFDQRLRAAIDGDAVVAVELDHLMTGTSAESLTRVDLAVEGITAALRAEDTLLVAGVSDRYGQPPRLRVALAVGPGFQPGGELRSALTRRDGFVQLIDLAPTVVALVGAPRGAGMVGRQWTRVPSSAASLDARVERMVDADRAADGYRRYVPAFFTLLVLAQFVLYGAAFVALRRLRTTHAGRRVVAVTRGFALGFAAVPAATYLAHLAPWWRHSLPFLVGLVAAVVGLLYVAAACGPWRHRPLGPEGAVAAITFAVIAVDLLTGARLQMSSLAGYSPVVAGRFAGVGNVAFAVFATGGLLAAAALCVGASARRAVAIVATIGVVAVVVDGSPLWGSDFGGVLALVPAFAVLGLLVSGRRVSWRSVTLIAVAAVLVVAMFALVDYARPAESQTHLGRFVGQLLHGGAGAVVRRKAQANLRLLTSSVLTLVVPVAVLFLTLVLLRPVGGLRRAFAAVPPLRAGLISVLVLGVAGFVFNDSGVAVPALALTLAVPIALAASLAARERPDGQRDSTPA
jgi:hypothetical protein